MLTQIREKVVDYAVLRSQALAEEKGENVFVCLKLIDHVSSISNVTASIKPKMSESFFDQLCPFQNCNRCDLQKNVAVATIRLILL